jgi:hypothetical protein
VSRMRCWARHCATCIGFVQVVNELLRKQISQSSQYRSMFQSPKDPRVSLILAFEYVRHVTQHVDPVRPQPTCVVGGFGPGYRTYAISQAVAVGARAPHTKYSGTQAIL